MNKASILRIFPALFAVFAMLMACGATKSDSSSDSSDSSDAGAANADRPAPAFSADSAYSYAARQVAFGPRVPGSDAHRKCGEWLASTLRSHGAEVEQQTSTITTFDGTCIPMRNIIARINPSSPERILLLAHWDSRPWADNDPDPAKHDTPVDGANDGASGTALLLELSRVLAQDSTFSGTGVDILLCDAEDWGTENNDESWAMGARYFARDAAAKGYMPKAAILVDMVGAPDATFMREYFSQQAAPALADEIWNIAASLGYASMFPNRMGSAVNDDHVELIKAGIPAIDIIDYREGSGFFPAWHTTADNLDAICPATLGAVGSVLEHYLRHNN